MLRQSYIGKLPGAEAACGEQVAAGWGSRLWPAIPAAASCLDLLLLMLSGYGTYIACVGWHPEAALNYTFAIVSVSALLVAALNRGGWYSPYLLRQFQRQALQILRVSAGVALFFVVVAFVFKISGAYSRLWAFTWLGAGVVVLTLARLLWSRWIAAAQRQGAFCRRIAVVGATTQAGRFLQAFRRVRHPTYRVVGVYDDRSLLRRQLPDEPALAGGLADLYQAVRRGQVDDVFLALPWTAEDRIRQFLAELRQLPVNIRLLPDMAGFIRAGARVVYLADLPTLDLLPRPIDERDLLVKATFDRIVALALILLLAPLLALIALAVKLESPGPILFRQRRCGFNNGTFEVLKFRSMSMDACVDPQARQATKRDPRVTRIGRLLRRTSLDELPQLFNVLDGSMSLVGPRPHAVQHHAMYEKLIDDYSIRHKVKPGITGWAQVNGLRGETGTVEKMAARVAADAFYIENWSLGLDLKILAKTVAVVLFQSAAY